MSFEELKKELHLMQLKICEYQETEELKHRTDAYGQNGVVCPNCNGFNNKVVGSEYNKYDYRIRRRSCVCGYRWNTVEVRCCKD